MPKIIYPVIFLLFLASRLKAQDSILDAGIRLQKTVNLYSENGIAFDFSASKFLNDKLYFGFSYATSRLGTAFHSNAIKQDNFLVSAAWYLRHSHVIRPILRLNTGYFSADYGAQLFDILPQKSLLLSSDIGLCFDTGTPLKISTSLGYNFITGNGLNGPGTLFPVFYQLTLSWDVLKPLKHPKQIQKLKL